MGREPGTTMQLMERTVSLSEFRDHPSFSHLRVWFNFEHFPF